MSEHEHELHPRLIQAHADFHSAPPYREAIRMVDAGHFASAIPPSHRSGVKNFVELALLHFHDLGFREAMSGSAGAPDEAWQPFEEAEVGAVRQRLEALLNRLTDEFRRMHREMETKWKAAGPHDPRKQQYFRDMNEHRRNLSKVLSLDKTTFILKTLTLAKEGFEHGWERGLALRAANDRKQRLGLPVEEITVPVRLFVDPSDDAEAPLVHPGDLLGAPPPPPGRGREYH